MGPQVDRHVIDIDGQIGTGRALSASPAIVVWLAMLGWPWGPEPTFGAPETDIACSID